MKKKEKLATICAIFILIIGAYYLLIEDNYPYQQEISGVKVYSQIPLEKLKDKERVLLFKNKDVNAITCNFEIAAISTVVDSNGYNVHIEEGDLGLYIKGRSAYIKGEGEDILSSCHVLACLLSGIECPEDFSEVKNTAPYNDNFNLIVDLGLGQKGIEAYTELLGVLGFLQAERADLNRDGRLSVDEKEGNTLLIHPYIKRNSTCQPQEFMNLLQENLSSNESRNCQEIESGIFLLKSSSAKIEVQDHKILLLGNESNVYEEAIIVRDILSPEWIRVIYRLS